MEGHRNVEPAVYNSRRLNEHPVPMPARQFDSNVAVDESFNSDAAESSGDVYDDETSAVNLNSNASHSDLSSQSVVRDNINNTNDSEGNEHRMLNSMENVSIELGQRNDSYVDDEDLITEFDSEVANANHDESDPLAVSTELVDDDRPETGQSIDHMIDGLGSTQNEQSQTEATDGSVGETDGRTAVFNATTVKVEPLPVYDNHVANNNDIDDVLDEPVEDELDGVTIVIGRAGIPKPLSMTAEKTIKRENDKMSGNITYSVSVRMNGIDKNVSD